MRFSLTILLSILIGSIPYYSIAQETSDGSVKRLKLYDVQFQTGAFSQPNNSIGIEGFRILAPKSEILNRDFSDIPDSYGIITSSNSYFSTLLGFQFRNAQGNSYKLNPVLRVGFSFFSNNHYSHSISKSVRKQYDQVTSSQSGETLYFDSISSESYSMNHSSEQIRLDASLIFSTNPESRWSLYSGLGVNAGASLHSKTNVSYFAYERREIRHGDGYRYADFNSYSAKDADSESFENRTNFGGSVYVPMGIDFRIGRNSEFWKRIHIISEFRPNISVTSIPEIGTITNGSFSGGIGVKVTL